MSQGFHDFGLVCKGLLWPRATYLTCRSLTVDAFEYRSVVMSPSGHRELLSRQVDLAANTLIVLRPKTFQLRHIAEKTHGVVGSIRENKVLQCLSVIQTRPELLPAALAPIHLLGVCLCVSSAHAAQPQALGAHGPTVISMPPHLHHIHHREGCHRAVCAAFSGAARPTPRAALPKDPLPGGLYLSV